jgi:hypothetical protein
MVKELPTFYGAQKIKYRVYKTLPPVSVLSQMNPFHNLPPDLSKTHFSTVLPSTPKSSKLSICLFRLPDQNFVCIFLLLMHDTFPAHASLLD